MSEKQVQYIQHFRGINNSNSTEISTNMASNLENLVFDVDDELLKSANFITKVSDIEGDPANYDKIFTFAALTLKYAYNDSTEYIVCVGVKSSTVYFNLFRKQSDNTFLETPDEIYQCTYYSDHSYGAIVVGDTLRLVYYDGSNYKSKWWGYLTNRNIIYKDNGSFEYEDENGYGIYENTLNNFGISISELTETDETIEDETSAIDYYKQYAISAVINYTQETELFSKRTFATQTRKSINVKIAIDTASFDKRITSIKLWRQVSDTLVLNKDYEQIAVINLTESVSYDSTETTITEIPYWSYSNEWVIFGSDFVNKDSILSYINSSALCALISKTDLTNIVSDTTFIDFYYLYEIYVYQGHFVINTSRTFKVKKLASIIQPTQNIEISKTDIDFDTSYFVNNSEYTVVSIIASTPTYMNYTQSDQHEFTAQMQNNRIFFLNNPQFAINAFKGHYLKNSHSDLSEIILENDINTITLNNSAILEDSIDGYYIEQSFSGGVFGIFSDDGSNLIYTFEDKSTADYHTSIYYNETVGLVSNSLPHYESGLVYANRLFVVDGNSIKWSKLLEYDSFPLENSKIFKTNIEKLINFKDLLVVFSKADIYFLDYSGDELSWREHDSIGDIGTTYINTIVSTPVGLFFANKNGVYVLLSQMQMGKQSYSEYQKIDTNSGITTNDNMVAWYDQKESRYIIWDNETRNEWIYSLRFKAWTKVFNDTNMGTMIGVANFDNENVFVMDIDDKEIYNISERTYPSTLGETVYRIETPWITMGLPQVKKKFKRLHVRIKLKNT